MWIKGDLKTGSITNAMPKKTDKRTKSVERHNGNTCEKPTAKVSIKKMFENKTLNPGWESDVESRLKRSPRFWCYQQYHSHSRYHDHRQWLSSFITMISSPSFIITITMPIIVIIMAVLIISSSSQLSSLCHQLHHHYHVSYSPTHCKNELVFFNQLKSVKSVDLR